MNLGGSQSYDQLVNGLGFQQHEQQHEPTVHHEFQHVTTTAVTVATSSVFSFSDSLISSTSSYPADLPTEKVSSGAGDGFLQVPTRAGLNLSEWQLSQLQGLTPSGVQCLVSNWLNLAKNPIEQPYCNATWDEIYCWPPTLAGETVRRACSEVMKDDTEIDSAKLIGDAYRICSSDATWFWGNWTNYNICLTEIENSLRDARDLEGVIFAVRYILFTGSILSLLCLCVALFIFYYFKSIRCDRILVHVQLMVALALRFLLLIIITEPFIFHRKNHYRNVDWICKVVLALQLYATVASVNWMFVQGHYLHSRLTTNVFDHGFPLKTYVGLGWGLPLFLISIWAAIMEVYHPVPCWKNYGDLDYCWIIVGPMLFVLLLNLIFLANIMRILLTKIQLTSTASETEQFRRAVKATAVLFPLLGINNLLFFYNPGGSLLGYYMITNSVLQSSQGIFVSLLYCFICKDVKDAIRREYGRFSARRSANSMRSQSRRSGGGGTIRDKLLNRSQRGRQMSASYTRSPHNHKLTTSSVKSERTAAATEDASPGLETIKFFQTDLTPPPGGGTENETKIDCHHLVHHNKTINGMPNNHNPTALTTVTATTTGLLSAPTRDDYNNRQNSSQSSSMSEVPVTRCLHAANRTFSTSTETEIY